MKALHHWGVVIRWQDKAKTEADFVRTRDRYQLTSEAADLHRWLRRKIDEDGVATSAAAFAPAVIADRLDDTLLAWRSGISLARREPGPSGSGPVPTWTSGPPSPAEPRQRSSGTCSAPCWPPQPVPNPCG